MRSDDHAARDELRARAEIDIERILRDLIEKTGAKLSHVDVDTQNFANCNVEIFFDET